jgi:aldehyde dehydrogenase (NAD+)
VGVNAMNAVMKETNNIAALFQRVAAHAPTFAQTTAEERIERINRLYKAIMAARPAIHAAGRKELRLIDLDIDGQLLMLKTEYEFIAKNLKTWMQPEPVQGSLMTVGKRCYVQYQPKGVVLHVSTWNAPIAEAFIPGFGALAAGNPFVLKPSELAPESAQVLADIVASVLPEEEFAVVQGGPEVAQELLRQPFNHIFYIGGHGVGRIIMKAAAEHFATVTLEMGGKNPTIIDASADVDDAARKTSWGRVCNAGQVCLAPDYALVHRSVERAFVGALAKHMTCMYNADGRGFQKSEYLPRIVNSRHFERIKGLLDDAIAKGAKVEFGGETDAADLFIGPTILSNVNGSMRIMQEEIFGPIICIVPFEDREEAVREIRSRPKPLGSYVFAKDRAAIDWWLAHTTSGSVVVNHNLIQSGTNPHLAFGGVNASGIGRLCGKATFLECSNPRAVMEDGKGLGDPNMMFPPYSDKYRQAIEWMLNKGMNLPDGVINFLNALLRLGKR